MSVESVKKMYDHSDCIRINKEKSYIVNGEEYYRIECIKEFKDTYAKRTIKKGEAGGLIHSSINKVEHWIEDYQMVGKAIIETVIPTMAHKKEITHSCILNFKEPIIEIYKFWILKCGEKEASLFNAYVHHSKRIWDFADEMYAIEDRFLKQSNDPTDSQMILLWVTLGALLEAILKLHFVALRKKYSNFVKDASSITKLKVNTILDCLKEDGTLSNYEYVILSKVNGNRNMIHFLNNEQIYSYDEYKSYVGVIYDTLLKLYKSEVDNYKL